MRFTAVPEKRVRKVAKTERGKKLMPMVQALFMQPDNAEPHDDHFHVRIRCPKDQADICKENPK